MDKKVLMGIAVILLIASTLIVVRFLTPEDTWICFEGEWVKHGDPEAGRPTIDCPDKANFANIVIKSPEADQVVGKNLVITGKARVFENQFNWAILDGITKQEILAGTAHANSEDAGLYGPFEINISLNDLIPNKIIAQVFDYSAKDGSKQDIVEVPLNFNKNLKDYYEVYFSNSKLDPEGSCLKVFSIKKPVGNEELSLHKSIEVLLQGPSDIDKGNGYFTNIPENVKVNKIDKAGISVRVDLSKDIENGMGGSCRVAAVRAQIIKTVLVFDKSVRSVTISVEGETETALQP
ncbi:MAG: Gmad2 immunoglobulin-like domain-containing protein [Minisyncoccota bacterium]